MCDESAEWKGRELWDNLVTGAGAHAKALLVVISTKSPDPNHVMSELVRYGEQVLEGEIRDRTFLPIIYAAPADADPWAEETWRACNPALGDFRSLEEMRVSAAQAKRLPAREPSFRLLYLNEPIDAASRFLNAVDWNACKAGIYLCHLGGKLRTSATGTTSAIPATPRPGCRARRAPGVAALPAPRRAGRAVRPVARRCGERHASHRATGSMHQLGGDAAARGRGGRWRGRRRWRSRPRPRPARSRRRP